MNNLIPLSSWLLEQAEDPSVAVDASGNTAAVSRTELVAKVAAWYQHLEPLTDGCWALYHPDPVEFVAALQALWQLGRSACIPGDNCAGTVARLGPHVVGFIGDFPTAPKALDRAEPARPCAAQRWQPLAADFVALEVFTSGSSGEPKAIPKTLRQLEQEIETLERLWPSDPGTVVVATVSHQHIYGLLFRLLWPLCSQRPIDRALCHYPEDIQLRAVHYPKLTLVSSPSHLNRLTESSLWQDLNRSLRVLFSSAAPLTRTTSLRVRSLMGKGVCEIYGSSETGGIAWRMQEPNTEARWQPLPGVDLRADEEGVIWLRSAHLPASDEMVLPDRVELEPGGRFVLLDRADRVAKIEGKRVALNAMEQQLCQLPWVTAASCLVLQRRRVEVAAVLQLTALGRALMDDLGKRALVRQLREQLQSHFEAVVLPRRWRIVEALPYNPQGKLPLAALQRLFDPESSPAPISAAVSRSALTEPRVIHESRDGHSACLELEISADLRYFEGHFSPQNMILPGVVQVHWAELFGRQLFAIRGLFLRLEVVKFQQLIGPGQTLSLVLKWVPEKNKLSFSYSSVEGVHSSGRICFGAEDV